MRPRSPSAQRSRDQRGNVEDRRRRKVWLVEAFRADVDVAAYHAVVEQGLEVDIREERDEPLRGELPVKLGQGEPACRCWRCGRLLTVETVSPDRILPGCRGGGYQRWNLRPSCMPCQRITGNLIRIGQRSRP